ncbi:MAG TPA: preprotein translocase subunit SecE [Thermoanaerobaculaceae bacterium]|nr:preprotein translocase subunit SecE [Thermoanaerobaculaceae bacterium]HRS17649.1 preprotein translocase subunit SecE [Thermoanaerobaculaceae bacterium]
MSFLQRIVSAWQRLRTFLREVVVETRKVSWPSREEVMATTAVVIAASFIFGIYLYLCDFVFFRAVNWVIRALS